MHEFNVCSYKTVVVAVIVDDLNSEMLVFVPLGSHVWYRPWGEKACTYACNFDESQNFKCYISYVVDAKKHIKG